MLRALQLHGLACPGLELPDFIVACLDYVLEKDNAWRASSHRDADLFLA